MWGAMEHFDCIGPSSRGRLLLHDTQGRKTRLSELLFGVCPEFTMNRTSQGSL